MPEEQHQVRLVQCLVTAAVPEQPGHADIERVVVLQDVFAPQRVSDRSVEQPGQLEHLLSRVGAADAAEDGDLVRGPMRLRELGDRRFVRAWAAVGCVTWRLLDLAIRMFGEDVAGQHQDGRALLADRVLDRAAGQPDDLVGVGDRLAVVTGLREQRLRLGLLEISGADLPTGDMCGEREDTGAPERCASMTPWIRWVLPGPQLPAHTASRPVSCASADAANAAASSLWTCTQSMPPLADPPLRRTASLNALRLSPDQPVDPMDAGLYEYVEKIIGYASGHVAVLVCEVGLAAIRSATRSHR